MRRKVFVKLGLHRIPRTSCILYTSEKSQLVLDHAPHSANCLDAVELK